MGEAPSTQPSRPGLLVDAPMQLNDPVSRVGLRLPTRVLRSGSIPPGAGDRAPSSSLPSQSRARGDHGDDLPPGGETPPLEDDRSSGRRRNAETSARQPCWRTPT